MTQSITDIAIVELTKLVSPLRRLRTTAGVSRFVRELGWDFEGELNVELDSLSDLVDALLAAGLELADVKTEEDALEVLQKLAPKLPDIFRRLKGDIPQIEAALRVLQNTGNLIGKSDELAATVSRRLMDRLFYQYLESYQPQIFAIMHVAGLADIVVDDYSMPVCTIHWERIELVFSDPMDLLNQVYDWNTVAGFNGNEFLTRMDRFMRAFLLPGGIYQQSPIIHAALKRAVGDDQELRVPLFQGGHWPDDYREFDINITPVPKNTDESKNAGLAFYPYFFGGLEVEQALGSGWSLALRGNADVKAGLGVTFRAPHALELTTDLFSNESSSTQDTRLEMIISKATESNDLVYIFGDDNTTHLGFQQTGVRGLVALDGGKEEFGVEFELLGLTLKVGTDDADSFIDKLLSSVQIETTCDLALGYSNLNGAYFRGGGGLEILIPLHKVLGPIFLDSILIGMAIDKGFIITLAASFGAELGPIAASVDRIGLRIPISFPPNQDGNLGPLQIESPIFKPPTGAGLAIDAGAIAGGGYLDFDDPNKRYAGNLQLQAGGVGLVATGLITTRLPDGSDGFALLVNIGVEFMPPIQLSFGFTLSGVGGLLGYNRTMKVDVLREGLRSRTLDSILFPEDPIANAPKIISDLRAVFPPQEGRFIIGPIVKIGWGSPNIIQADIGIFIELPGPVRVVLLGQIAVALPKADKAIVELHIDVLGVIEFDKQLLSIDATLYDSRIYEYPLTGDAALRLSWGDAPVFAMSLGGFHPRFSPPPNFPALRRLTLNLSQGSALQLYCRAYQALTSNSLQFGARVDLFAKKGGATVEGNLSFDALIYFLPFSFVVAISGNVVARYKGCKLTGVHLSLALSGPTPWNARGRASFEILWLDLSVTFNKTWGPRQPVAIEAVNPWPPLKDALEDNDNWGSKLPGRSGMVEMLAEMDEDKGAAPPLILHPAGSLEIRQNVLPLEVRLDKLGNAPVKDHYKFEIANISIEDETLDLAPVEEYFARGQFINLSDSERLSRPSFEKMKAGVAASSDRLAFKGGWVQPADLTYESILIQEDRTSKTANFKDKAILDWRVANHQLFGNAARRSGLRTTGRRKFETQGKAKQVGVVREGYTLVNNANMSPVGVPGNNGTIGLLQAEQLLSEYLQSKPRMAGEVEIVPSFEVAA